MKLIYISGIDGCGKTTQSKKLVSHLNEMDFNAQYQWLRWSPSIGKIINLFKKENITNQVSDSKNLERDTQLEENKSFSKWYKFKNNLFSSKTFSYFWLKYATWDYYISYKQVSKKWTSNILVLDRYYFDFIIDQSINFNESPTVFDETVNRGILKQLRKPDIFIIIDIPPQVGWERKRDGTSIEHLKKLDNAYKTISLNKNIYIVDGTQTENKVSKDINEIVLKELT